MSLPVREFKRGSADVLISERSNVLRISGILRDPEVQSWLYPLFEDVHRAAAHSKLSEVVLDLRALEYANAAAWRCIVLWLRLLREDQHARYRLHIQSQPRYQWQRVGIPALVAFGQDRLVV